MSATLDMQDDDMTSPMAPVPKPDNTAEQGEIAGITPDTTNNRMPTGRRVK